MLSPFLRFPARGRCLHPAADAAALCAAAISGLKPATLASAEGLVGAMMSQSGAGASRREGQAEVAHAFAAGTASMPADEAEGLVCAILGVLAATNGVWSDEYRRGSHALYMALMGRRWAGSGAHEGALRGGLDDHTRLPAHAELVERLGIRHAADSHGGLEAKSRSLVLQPPLERARLPLYSLCLCRPHSREALGRLFSPSHPWKHSGRARAQMRLWNALHKPSLPRREVGGVFVT